MPKYMTKQRKNLLSFLSVHADEEFSARQISEMLDDSTISISAVYRNLAELEKGGKIRRISKNGSREVFYRYIDEKRCKNHLHLSCEKCGKTFHMNMSGTDELVKSVALGEEFAIDRVNTVLYGVCKECLKEEKEGNH